MMLRRFTILLVCLAIGLRTCAQGPALRTVTQRVFTPGEPIRIAFRGTSPA